MAYYMNVVKSIKAELTDVFRMKTVLTFAKNRPTWFRHFKRIIRTVKPSD